MGFPVPLGKWFRGQFRPVIDEYVTGERAMSRGLFDADYVRRLVARHLGGENHTERLWTLVNFEMWLRQFIDGEEAGEPQLELSGVAGNGNGDSRAGSIRAGVV
jgi:asparagine synthase (glutamine-hydrolysing)